jgi:hypothetical protein
MGGFLRITMGAGTCTGRETKTMEGGMVSIVPRQEEGNPAGRSLARSEPKKHDLARSEPLNNTDEAVSR